jgi:hypothetical protein
MELTSEERQQVLADIERRQILEKSAFEQERLARQEQSELEYRQGLADAARRIQQERKERLENSLETCLDLIRDALQSIKTDDESQAYRLLVRADSFFVAAKHGINQPAERPNTALLPTVRVRRAGTAQGWCVVNLEDVSPADEIILEDSDG